MPLLLQVFYSLYGFSVKLFLKLWFNTGISSLVMGTVCLHIYVKIKPVFFSVSILIYTLSFAFSLSRTLKICKVLYRDRQILKNTDKGLGLNNSWTLCFIIALSFPGWTGKQTRSAEGKYHKQRKLVPGWGHFCCTNIGNMAESCANASATWG